MAIVDGKGAIEEDAEDKLEQDEKFAVEKLIKDAGSPS